MKRHHYGKSRYDLVKDGCLTVRAKVMDGKLKELMDTAIEFAKKIDGMGDFDFAWQTWWYEQNFNCKLGTTEMLVECMLVEKFQNEYWNGEYGKDDHMKSVVLNINIKNLTLGQRYEVAYW